MNQQWGPAPGQGPGQQWGPGPGQQWGPAPGQRPGQQWGPAPGQVPPGWAAPQVPQQMPPGRLPRPGRRRRRVLTVVLSVLGTLVLAAGGLFGYGEWYKAHRKPYVSESVVRGRAVEAALPARSKALRDKDERAYLAWFDPADKGLISRQRLLFRNLTAMPLENPTFRRVLSDGDPYCADSTEVTGACQILIALTFQIRGVDWEPVVLAAKEHWATRGGRQVVVAEAEETVLGGPKDSPWRTVPFRVSNGPRVTLLTTSDVSAPDQAAYRTQGEKAAAAALGVWRGRPGSSRFLVIVTHRKEQRTWFSDRENPGKHPAHAVGWWGVTPGSSDTLRIAGSAIVVDLKAAPASQAYVTLRHEMTHALGMGVQAPVKAIGGDDPYPIWVEEGFATWNEEPDTPLHGSRSFAELRRLSRRFGGVRMPPAQRVEFYSEDGDIQSANYNEAAMVFRYIATRWGRAKAVQFYVDMASGRQQVISHDLGMSEQEFGRAWLAWISHELARG